MARRMRRRLGLLLVVACVRSPSGRAPAGLAARESPGSIQNKIESKQGQIEQQQGPRARADVGHLALRRTGSTRCRATSARCRHARCGSRPTSSASAPSSRAPRTTCAASALRLVRLRARLPRRARCSPHASSSSTRPTQPDLVTVILESNGFADLLERDEFMQRISEQDAADHRARPQRQGGRDARPPSSSTSSSAGQADVADAIEAPVATRSSPSRASSIDRAIGFAQRAPASARAARVHARRAASSSRATLALDAGSRRRSSDPQRRRRRRPPARARSAAARAAMIWPVNGPITSPFCERAPGRPATRASTSASRPARRSAPPTAGRVALAGLDRRLRQLHLHPAQRLAVHLLRRTSRASASPSASTSARAR